MQAQPEDMGQKETAAGEATSQSSSQYQDQFQDQNRTASPLNPPAYGQHDQQQQSPPPEKGSSSTSPITLCTSCTTTTPHISTLVTHPQIAQSIQSFNAAMLEVHSTQHCSLCAAKKAIPILTQLMFELRRIKKGGFEEEGCEGERDEKEGRGKAKGLRKEDIKALKKEAKGTAKAFKREFKDAWRDCKGKVEKRGGHESGY